MLAGVLTVGLVPPTALADENVSTAPDTETVDTVPGADTEQGMGDQDTDSDPSQQGDSDPSENPPQSEDTEPSKDQTQSETPTPPDTPPQSEDTEPSKDQTPPETPSQSENTPEMPAVTSPLTDIIAADDEGNARIYTTLYDADYRVISTNDPDEERDYSYSTGGTVDKGSAVYVRFRLAEILPHDGETGVQEDVAYYLNGLPEELIPKVEDEDGNKIVDPESPVEFFRTSGDMNAYGDKTGPYFTPYASYTIEGSQRESLKASASNVTQDENGTTVRFKGVNGDLQVDVQFLRRDAVAGTQSNSGGKWSYITNTIHAEISDGKGGSAKNIGSLTLYVPTITYDDYERTGTTFYDGEISVSDETNSTSMNTTGQFNTDYNRPSTPSISSSAYDPQLSSSYEWLPARYYSYVYAGSSYRGNYFWMEYDPAV